MHHIGTVIVSILAFSAETTFLMKRFSMLGMHHVITYSFFSSNLINNPTFLHFGAQLDSVLESVHLR